MGENERKQRFDVAHFEHHATIEPHFCRSWEIGADGQDHGCYGTNPDHGYSFEEACDRVADWHEEQAKLWRSREHYLAMYYTEQDAALSQEEGK